VPQPWQKVLLTSSEERKSAGSPSMKENPPKGKVSHATDWAPEVLRHETQWQIADLEGSPDTLNLTLPQKHPPS
jgi:hypothetical protein